MQLSVVILTKNEEDCIAHSLKSVYGWADEIIVVDDDSSDQTVDIAIQYTDKIINRKMDIEGKHRNWCYAQARNRWVLSLDADETVSEALKEEIRGVLEKTACKAFAIPIKTYIGNYWVKYGGWYPASKVRLFDKECFRYEEVEVHPRVFVDGEIGQLTQDVIHKGYPDFEHFLNSLNRQTTLEAEKWIRTGKKMTGGVLYVAVLIVFFAAISGKKVLKTDSLVSW